jgi:hypothetical protein
MPLHATYQNIVLTELGKGCLDDAEYFGLLVPWPHESATSSPAQGVPWLPNEQLRCKRDILSAFIVDGRPAEPILTVKLEAGMYMDMRDWVRLRTF